MTKWYFRPSDLSRHMYILARSGAGKTSLMRSIANAIPDSAAFVYIDPKGDDAIKFVAQRERLDNVLYFDLGVFRFAINPIELPIRGDVSIEERERVQSMYTGSFMQILSEWYGSTADTAPRMLRIFRSLITYLYTITSAPTFVDLHDLIVQLQNDGESAPVMKKIGETLGKDEEFALRTEMKSISNFRADAFDSVLTRLSEFVIDPFLRSIFSARHSTIDFNEVMKPGRTTVFRLAGVGAHIIPLIQAMIVLRLWFAVQERAQTVPEEQRNLVILGLDEFETVEKLGVLTQILSMARSFGLGLILAHQNLAQVNDELLQTVLGNVSTIAIGRISAFDASRLAKIDTAFSRELMQALSTQPDYNFIIQDRPQHGEEQAPPFQTRLAPPPALKHSPEELNAFIMEMKAKFGASFTERSIFGEAAEWSKLLRDELPPANAWKVLLALKQKEGTKSKIAEWAALADDKELTALIETMRAQKKIKVRTVPHGASVIAYYSLAPDGEALVNPITKDAAPSEKGQEITKLAISYYENKGFFVGVADQTLGRNQRPDLIIYDYTRDEATAIEIESDTEVKTHAEQVKRNMMKYKGLGFPRLCVWCSNDASARVNEIKNEITDAAVRDNIEVHAV